jgi:hypothetical protein
MSELLEKLNQSVENLKSNSSKIYFFVQDTKGTPKASIKYIYEMAWILKQSGQNPHILHEKQDYFGVQDWLGQEYMTLPHISVEGQQLQIAPEDTVIIPELFGYIMSQITKLPCAKIVLCQSYDYMFETLQPGQNWSQLGFTKCITTSEKLKTYISQNMRNTSIDVIEPLISEKFTPSKFPAKPVVAVHSRESRDTMNLIKQFYVKFPQYRWITFRDMRGLSIDEFSTVLRECMVSVWVDDISSFGTFPLESMASNVPVIAKTPNLNPEWMNENNGIWAQNTMNVMDILADFIQNWLEDNISPVLYAQGLQTSELYKDSEKFKSQVLSLFEKYREARIENFTSEINKLELENAN